jgi:hypothetical protein
MVPGGSRTPQKHPRIRPPKGVENHPSRGVARKVSNVQPNNKAFIPVSLCPLSRVTPLSRELEV